MLRSQHDVALSALDSLSVGLVFVDRSGAFVSANSSGEAILRDADGLAIKRGRLVASDGRETDQLNAILRNVCDPRRLIDPTTQLSARITRPNGGRPFDVMACSVASDAPHWAADRAAAFLVISDGTAALDGTGTRLRELYGLSATEAQVAIAIANGTTVQEHAASRGISVETVRWQLKQVFAKTDVTRQSDLARIVLLGPAMAR
jgi:DNA-binding CsgD family transcriptional regulator